MACAGPRIVLGCAHRVLTENKKAVVVVVVVVVVGLGDEGSLPPSTHTTQPEDSKPQHSRWRDSFRLASRFLSRLDSPPTP